MSGLFGTLGTATRGMNISQYALQTSSHNIANTTTEGYSRQRVNIQTEQPYYLPGVGSIGMGAKSSGVARVVDSFVRGQTLTANSLYTYNEQKADLLGQIETIFGEPSKTGIINQLMVMYDSWSKLASNPELSAAKTSVVENTNTFTDMLHQMSSQMEQLKSDAQTTLDKTVLDFNEKVTQLQTLNSQIFAIASDGGTPNDLLDTRDNILKDLSGMAEISVDFDAYGRVASLKVGIDLEENNVVLDSKGNYDVAAKVSFISQGAIGGLQKSQVEIDERLSELNHFAANFATSINEKYVGFFEGTSATDLTVNADLRKDPHQLVTGSGLAGDSTLAKEISDLFNSGTPTFAEQYNTIVTRNGITKQQADNRAASQLTLLNQLEYKDQSVSGVNINEEISDVIRFSQAFQANAKVLQTISEMLDTLINRTGV